MTESSSSVERPTKITVDMRLMDALSNAELVAYANPGSTVAIYQSLAPLRPDTPYGTVRPLKYSVLLNTDPVPEGAQLVTTVTRHPLDSSDFETLRKVINQIVANLPVGVKLEPRAIIEYYPKRQYESENFRSVFAYQFMSTEGRNVATWIPDVNTGMGAQMQSGFDGRGRPWKNGGITDEPTRDISYEIKAAEAQLAALAALPAPVDVIKDSATEADIKAVGTDPAPRRPRP